MTMNYHELTLGDYANLRRQRLLALEADHYKLALLIEESNDDDEIAQLHTRQGELERRIAAHRPVDSAASD